jgi:hypothetical protein
MTTAQLPWAVGATTRSLTEAGILRQVLAYLAGNWLCLGAVCSEVEVEGCLHMHGRSASVRLERIRHRASASVWSQDYSYSAAVTSPATARLACELGLQISADDD